MMRQCFPLRGALVSIDEWGKVGKVTAENLEVQWMNRNRSCVFAGIRTKSADTRRGDDFVGLVAIPNDIVRCISKIIWGAQRHWFTLIHPINDAQDLRGALGEWFAPVCKISDGQSSHPQFLYGIPNYLILMLSLLLPALICFQALPPKRAVFVALTIVFLGCVLNLNDPISNMSNMLHNFFKPPQDAALPTNGEYHRPR